MTKQQLIRDIADQLAINRADYHAQRAYWTKAYPRGVRPLQWSTLTARGKRRWRELYVR